jgi:hypothetical protein
MLKRESAIKEVILTRSLAMKTKEMSNQQQGDKRLAPIFSSLIRRRALVFITAALICCAAIAMGVRAYHRNASSAEISLAKEGLVTQPAAISTPMQSQITGPIQVVQFAIYDVGIYPGEVTLQAGNVGIIIEDFSGETSGLLVEQVAGNSRSQVAAVLRDGQFMRGRQNMKLAAGSYEVFAAERPDRRAKLIVE